MGLWLSTWGGRGIALIEGAVQIVYSVLSERLLDRIGGGA